MRKILLAAIVLGIGLTRPAPAGAGAVLGFGGFNRGAAFGFGAPVVVVPAYPAYPFYPGYQPYVPYVPYAYGPSYFRPDIPYGSNAQRNWRDTWQDDGVKLHTYTLH